MILHNIDFFESWMEELQSSIKTNNVEGMIKYRAMFTSKDFTDELIKILPGMFK